VAVRHTVEHLGRTETVIDKVLAMLIGATDPIEVTVTDQALKKFRARSGMPSSQCRTAIERMCMSAIPTAKARTRYIAAGWQVIVKAGQVVSVKRTKKRVQPPMQSR